jgi:hypothetical protein
MMTTPLPSSADPAQPVPVEIRKMLVLSTGHISKATADYLTKTPAQDWPFCGGTYGPYGWFFYAHDENAGEGDQAIPDDLWACMVFARAQGCPNLLLDEAGDHTDELPSYDW